MSSIPTSNGPENPRDPAFANTLRVHGFAAIEPGPRLIVLGGVHGNETCGTVAIERVLAEIDSGAIRLLRGQLTMVPVANPLARELKQREGERNLNRTFRPTDVPADYEDRITNLLCPLLDRHDVLLDLHSFTGQGEAFAMIGPRDNPGPLEPFARAAEEGLLALHIGTSRVVEGWLDIYAASLAQRAGGVAADAASLAFGWGTNEYMRSRGGYGVTLECGQHRDAEAPEVAYRAILAALRLLGMVEVPEGTPEPVHPTLMRLVGVVDRLDDGDQFVREWDNFDAVSKGDPIGVRADGTMLLAESDGFMVFPHATAPFGTEWFYFAVASERNLAAPKI